LEQKKEQKGTNLFQKEQKRNKNHLKIIFTISYMSKYYCSHCDYDAKVKGNFDRHLKTKKHQKLAKISPKLAEISQKLAKISPKLAEIHQKILKHMNVNIATKILSIIRLCVNTSNIPVRKIRMKISKNLHAC
jgi:hypothetical protein